MDAASRPGSRTRLSRAPSWWVAQLGLIALAAYHLWDLVGCGGGCFADIDAIFGTRIGGLSLPDMRLNSWILAWSQRTLLSSPGSLFDANVFFPADDGLTGSEHMLGVSALLLPTRLFGPSAVSLHQMATVASFLIMGWSTFALARWATRSDWAAFVAGATAMFMPWRIFELAHVQLPGHQREQASLEQRPPAVGQQGVGEDQPVALPLDGCFRDVDAIHAGSTDLELDGACALASQYDARQLREPGRDCGPGDARDRRSQHHGHNDDPDKPTHARIKRTRVAFVEAQP